MIGRRTHRDGSSKGSIFAAALLLVGSVLAGPAALSGQGLQTLIDRCADGNPLLQTRCEVGALTFQAANAGVGLLAAGGSDFPGMASTIGHRVGGIPRVSITGRAGVIELDLPRFRNLGQSLGSEEGFYASGIQLGAEVGLFDGFSLMPTLGGVLAVDLQGYANFLFLPEDQGYDGGTSGFGFGARIGLVRESFTLPGISVGLGYRNLGALTLGSADDGDDAIIDFEPSVRSVRATVGKDLFGLGLMVGWGWDDYKSDVDLFIQNPLEDDGAGGFLSGRGSASDVSTDRSMWFGGLSLNFIVFQISGEVGWADGLADLENRGFGGAFDPNAGTFFLNVAGRLTY